MSDTDTYIVLIRVSGEDGGWMFEPNSVNVDLKKANKMLKRYKKQDTECIVVSADIIAEYEKVGG